MATGTILLVAAAALVALAAVLLLTTAARRDRTSAVGHVARGDAEEGPQQPYARRARPGMAHDHRPGARTVAVLTRQERKLAPVEVAPPAPACPWTRPPTASPGVSS